MARLLLRAAERPRASFDTIEKPEPQQPHDIRLQNKNFGRRRSRIAASALRPQSTLATACGLPEHIVDDAKLGKVGIAEALVLNATAQKTGLAFLGTTLDIKAPVVAGDTVEVEIEVTEVRQERSGSRGLVRTRNIVRNQQQAVVMIYEPLRLMMGRPANDDGQ
ncbi:MaoC family dehydratase N-terminal domain-containing protein [Paracoccus sp. TK19116]|uniref:MaoC family dehydratase N-terminal domain-containing protein n=1 Tax=Paracoccus albicereus TaxID=2922394 RepID=A0ABT1MV89_9RHOB|nr:MaoC family dehydratase N-terminal domain-containing protein [Paracoccus albicereus]MCQ0972267.1 MaoC family dehydratase N-terminal domain-containing protein [Paracoccus albicereus]